MQDDRAPVLHPPATKRHVSVARLADHWYVACGSRQLRKRPIARRLLGIPMVLFRGADGPVALLDRCPHRNVPLALGKVQDGTLECAYHGWRFGAGGQCVAVPGLVGEPEHRGREAESYPTLEKDGYVWVWCDRSKEPSYEPQDLGGKPGYATIRAEMLFEGSVHAVAENALDVPHTAFLHGGLFRTSDKRNVITCKVRRTHDRVETQYIGEPRPTGLIGRLLAPGGGLVEHYDRFILPSLTQVEYKLSERSHVLALQALTPETDFVTRMYAVLHFKLPIVPAWLVRLIVQPIAMRILRQDAAVLALQTQNIGHFGGERYTSTDIDLLGPHIWHLLKMAERGELSGSESVERTVEMHV